MPRNKKSKNNLRLVIVFLASFLITFFISHKLVASANNIVILDDSGFSVQSLLIEKGERVVWKISGNNAHWPASDPHPIHTIYPEGGGCIGSMLDACRPLKSGEKYSFGFDKIGTWSVHDHLFHGNTMKVVVTEKRQILLFSILKQKSTSTNEAIKHIDLDLPSDHLALAIEKDCNQNQSCYMSILESITKKRGYGLAFEVVKELKKTDPAVAASCHRLAHGIGWTAYQIDSTHWKENLRKIDVDCNWGAIHGIVEQYVAANKKLDAETIKNLCAGDGACNHGIGHMLLVQTNNDIPKALTDCAVLKAGEQHMCMTGIFMERMTLQNLVDKENDSRIRRMAYWQNRLPEFEKMCEGFRTGQHEACWEEIARPAVGIFNGDPKKVFDFCNRSSTQEGANYCRRRAVSEIISSKKFDMMGLKYMCELAPDYDTNFPRDCYLRMANLALVSLPVTRKNEVEKFCGSIPISFTKACSDLISGKSINDSIIQNLLN